MQLDTTNRRTRYHTSTEPRKRQFIESPELRISCYWLIVSRIIEVRSAMCRRVLKLSQISRICRETITGARSWARGRNPPGELCPRRGPKEVLSPGAREGLRRDALPSAFVHGRIGNYWSAVIYSILRGDRDYQSSSSSYRWRCDAPFPPALSYPLPVPRSALAAALYSSFVLSAPLRGSAILSAFCYNACLSPSRLARLSSRTGCFILFFFFHTDIARLRNFLMEEYISK